MDHKVSCNIIFYDTKHAINAHVVKWCQCVLESTTCNNKILLCSSSAAVIKLCKSYIITDVKQSPTNIFFLNKFLFLCKLWKESLNSDGHQLQFPTISSKWPINSHLNWTHWTQKKTTTRDVRNLGPGFGTGTTIWWVKVVNGIPSPHSY